MNWQFEVWGLNPKHMIIIENPFCQVCRRHVSSFWGAEKIMVEAGQHNYVWQMNRWKRSKTTQFLGCFSSGPIDFEVNRYLWQDTNRTGIVQLVRGGRCRSIQLIRTQIAILFSLFMFMIWQISMILNFQPCNNSEGAERKFFPRRISIVIGADGIAQHGVAKYASDNRKTKAVHL